MKAPIKRETPWAGGIRPESEKQFATNFTTQGSTKNPQRQLTANETRLVAQVLVERKPKNAKWSTTYVKRWTRQTALFELGEFRAQLVDFVHQKTGQPATTISDEVQLYVESRWPNDGGIERLAHQCRVLVNWCEQAYMDWTGERVSYRGGNSLKDIFGRIAKTLQGVAA